MANPGKQDAPIERGHFDVATGTVRLEGEHLQGDGAPTPFRADGRLDGRTLRLTYRFGELSGCIDLVRVEEYQAPRRTVVDRLTVRLAGLQRRLNARSRPSGAVNAKRLRERGESLRSIIFRDAVAADIPALAELHVTTWNATYRTTRGPTIALFAELSNPTLGFYDRMGGERLVDERGQFGGAYAWRDVRTLLRAPHG